MISTDTNLAAEVTDDDGAMRAPDASPVVRPGEASGFVGTGPAGLVEHTPPPVITIAAPASPRWAGDPVPPSDGTT